MAEKRYLLFQSGPMKPAIETAPRLKDCKELGGVLQGQHDEKCGMRLRNCAIHGTCRTGIELDGIACCYTCPDHTEREIR